MRKDKSGDELAYGVQINLRASGSNDAATLIKKAVFTTPTRARKYIQADFREVGKDCIFNSRRSLGNYRLRETL